MRGLVVYLSVMTGVFSIQGCGRTSEDEVAKNDPHASQFARMQVSSEGIEGEWESGCLVEFAQNGDYQKTSMSLTRGGAITKKLSIFRDPNCARNPIWERIYHGKYQLTRTEFKQHYYSMTVVPQDYTQTNILNLGLQPEDRYCHPDTPFEVYKPKDFTPVSRCGEETVVVSKLDLRGSGGRARELFYNDVRLMKGSL